MRGFVWIVSYPRSGNTFLRALLANYFSDAARALTLDELAVSTVGEHIEAMWRELTGHAAADRTLEMEWRARASYLRALREHAAPAVKLFKSHTLNGAIFGVDAFEFHPKDRLVHVVRHPCDVALSVSAFYGIGLEAAVERLLTEGAVVDGRPDHGFEVIGSWGQHTRLWMNPVGPPIHRLRYFDLVENTAAALQAVLEFLGETPDPRRIQAAVAFSRFEMLSVQEALYGFSEGSTSGSEPFFRVGRTLQWPGRLGADQVARLTEANRELLTELGFDAYLERRLSAGAPPA